MWIKLSLFWTIELRIIISKWRKTSYREVKKLILRAKFPNNFTAFYCLNPYVEHDSREIPFVYVSMGVGHFFSSQFYVVNI